MASETRFDLYRDIQQRTNGEIYMGVVGPVRSGKSTFIKHFMEEAVIPNMIDEQSKSVAIDELPQSANGKTVMTTEPKFIPKEAAEIEFGEDTKAKIRLIDCVGYMVEGATGHMEAEEERMVRTPWFSYEIPFTKAAEIGTRKVIEDHSTVGVLVTTDGSFGEIDRTAYEVAEEKTVEELKKLGKPFIIILNSAFPFSSETKELAEQLQNKYNVNVVPISCEQMKKDDIERILGTLLQEFPLNEICFHIPKWTELLPNDHPVKQEMIEKAKIIIKTFTKIHDLQDKKLLEEDNNSYFRLDETSLDSGKAKIKVEVPEYLYYEHMSEILGTNIDGEYQLIHLIRDMADRKNEYEKVSKACSEVKENGYGIVMPALEEVRLEEPELIRHGNKYGVKLKATAPSVHMIQAEVMTEVAPIVGTKEQAEDLMIYMQGQSEQAEEGIWDTNIFGKTLKQLVEEGIETKIDKMTIDSRRKIQETMKKIVNESTGGVICLII